MTAMIAGLVGAGPAMADHHTGAKDGKVECHGGNSCKGKGECGGPNHSCAGLNTCKGQGYVVTESKEACLKLGGKLEAPKKKKKKA